MRAKPSNKPSGEICRCHPKEKGSQQARRVEPRSEHFFDRSVGRSKRSQHHQVERSTEDKTIYLCSDKLSIPIAERYCALRTEPESYS